MKEHTRLRRLYDSVIEYTNIANTKENLEKLEERTREIQDRIRELDEGEIIVGDLDTTRQILGTIYLSGIDGMEEEEKATVVKKLMELIQRKDGKIEDLVGVVKDLHSRCYRFVSMRDGLHRLRTRNLDLQTQVNNAEARLNEVLSEEEKTKQGKK